MCDWGETPQGKAETRKVWTGYKEKLSHHDDSPAVLQAAQRHCDISSCAGFQDSLG